MKRIYRFFINSPPSEDYAKSSDIFYHPALSDCEKFASQPLLVVDDRW